MSCIDIDNIFYNAERKVLIPVRDMPFKAEESNRPRPIPSTMTGGRINFIRNIDRIKTRRNNTIVTNYFDRYYMGTSLYRHVEARTFSNLVLSVDFNSTNNIANNRVILGAKYHDLSEEGWNIPLTDLYEFNVNSIDPFYYFLDSRYPPSRPGVIDPLPPRPGGKQRVMDKYIQYLYKNTSPVHLSYYFAEIDHRKKLFSIGLQYLSKTTYFQHASIADMFRTDGRLNPVSGRILFTLFDKPNSMECSAKLINRRGANPDSSTYYNFPALPDIELSVDIPGGYSYGTFGLRSVSRYDAFENFEIGTRSANNKYDSCGVSKKIYTIGFTHNYDSSTYFDINNTLQTLVNHLNTIYDQLNIGFQISYITKYNETISSETNLIDLIPNDGADLNYFVTRSSSLNCSSSYRNIGCVENALCDFKGVLLLDSSNLTVGLYRLAHLIGLNFGASKNDTRYNWLRGNTVMNTGVSSSRFTAPNAYKIALTTANCVSSLEESEKEPYVNVEPPINDPQPPTVDVPVKPPGPPETPETDSIEEVVDIIFDTDLPESLYLDKNDEIYLTVDVTALNSSGLPVNVATDRELAKQCFRSNNCYTWQVKGLESVGSDPLPPLNTPTSWRNVLQSSEPLSEIVAAGGLYKAQSKNLTGVFSPAYRNNFIEFRCIANIDGIEKTSKICKIYTKPSGFSTVVRSRTHLFTYPIDASPLVIDSLENEIKEKMYYIFHKTDSGAYVVIWHGPELLKSLPKVNNHTVQLEPGQTYLLVSVDNATYPYTINFVDPTELEPIVDSEPEPPTSWSVTVNQLTSLPVIPNILVPIEEIENIDNIAYITGNGPLGLSYWSNNGLTRERLTGSLTHLIPGNTYILIVKTAWRNQTFQLSYTE